MNKKESTTPSTITPPPFMADEADSDSKIEAAIQRVLDGDTSAYSTVISETEVKVRVILAAMLHTSASIDDVAQEVYLTAYRKLTHYEPGTDFIAWIKTITRNMALNERRRWAREQALKNRFQVTVEEKLQEHQNKVTEQISGKLTTRLAECLEKLNDPFKSIIKDFYYKNLSSKELAERLGKTDGAIRLMLWRSRSSLASCLNKKEAL